MNKGIFFHILKMTGLEGIRAYLIMMACLLCLLALLINLGVQPLFLEEPRRVMVAMEMWANGNLLVPIQLGEYYYKKPPFFNWILLGVVRLTGNYAEFGLRLPTVLSTLGIGLLTLAAGRRYVNAELGWLAGFLFIGSGGILFYFSTLAEIDLFYSFVTFASILGIYHFYQQKEYALLFISVYALAAIGTLTKGFPSIVFAGISILSFLIYEKRWRLLFSWQHILGGFIYLAMVGLYLWRYDVYHDLRPFFAEQFGESSQRTAASQGILSLIQHLIQFPLDTIKDLLPGAFLLLFLIRKDAEKLIRSHPFITFCALMFLANFLPYWISPGARQRYVYMLYPFLTLILAYAYQQRADLATWRKKTFEGISSFLLLVVFLASLSLPFIPDFQFLSYRYWLAPGFGLLTGGLIYGFWRYRNLAIYWLILATFAGRLIFDLTVLPQRAHHSGAQADKELAKKINEVIGEEEVYLFCSQRISFTTVVYLNQWREKTLVRNPQKNYRDFFIFDSTAYDDPRQTYLTFEYWGRTYELVKFLEPEPLQD